MNQQEYERFLVEQGQFEPEYAGMHAHQTYNPTVTVQQRIDASLRPEDRISGPEVLLRHLPALLETHDPNVVIQRIHQKRGHILSIREGVRQALRHLDLLKQFASPQQLDDLFTVLFSPAVIHHSPQIALDYAEQFQSVLRVLSSETDRGITEKIWNIICEYRALAPVLAFTAASALPPYLPREAIAEQTDAEHIRSDMILPRRYIDPSLTGSCVSAELLHEKPLDPEQKHFGACTVLETDDGTPVGSIKWEGYISMLGLRTVVDSEGRFTIMPGAIYKVGKDVERVVDRHRYSDARFARIRPLSIELQPVRTLGDFWPGGYSYQEYRALIDQALKHPAFAKKG